jgi:hypothetical protein
MTDTPQVLLQHHLKKLRLPTFNTEYDKQARQCAAENKDHVHYLLRLCEPEPPCGVRPQYLTCAPQLSDLCMQGPHIDHRFRLRLRAITENLDRALKQQLAPLLDPVRMDVAVLCQFDQSLLALDRGHRYFRLECRAVVPARSSCHGLLLARSIMPLLHGKSTYPGCSDLRNHLSGGADHNPKLGTNFAELEFFQRLRFGGWERDPANGGSRVEAFGQLEHFASLPKA